MIKGVAFVAYSVSDINRAVEFYRDVVGLEQVGLSGESWAEFDAGNTTFGVGKGESLGITPGTCFAVAFEVDDINAARQRLVDKGVKITEVMDSPTCWSAFATDPDGNRFALHKLKES